MLDTEVPINHHEQSTRTPGVTIDHVQRASGQRRSRYAALIGGDAQSSNPHESKRLVDEISVLKEIGREIRSDFRPQDQATFTETIDAVGHQIRSADGEVSKALSVRYDVLRALYETAFGESYDAPIEEPIKPWDPPREAVDEPVLPSRPPKERKKWGRTVTRPFANLKQKLHREPKSKTDPEPVIKEVQSDDATRGVLTRRGFLTGVAALGATAVLARSDRPEYKLTTPAVKRAPIVDVANAEIEETHAPKEEELLLSVGEQDIAESFLNLRSFMMGDHSFTAHEGSDKPGWAWDFQHPFSAITTQEIVYGDRQGLPEPSKIAARFFNGRGYYVDLGQSGGQMYMDDGLWLANQELRRIPVLEKEGDTADARNGLTRAITMFTTAFDKNSSDPGGGGIFWLNQPDEDNRRNVCMPSNGPAAELAMRLSEKDPSRRDYYIQSAKKIYEWNRANLMDSKDNLYWDNIDSSSGKPVVNRDKISYNQGPMIYAGVALARATGDDRYLREAEQTAWSAMQGDTLTNPHIMYDSIYYNNLLTLYTATKDADLQKRIKKNLVTYANNLYNNPKFWDKTNHLYKPGDPGSKETPIQGQAGATDIYTFARVMNRKDLTEEKRIKLLEQLS